MHRPVGLEHGTQCPEARVGVREMVQYAGAHDLIESRAEVARSLGLVVYR
jgi:hypothetical protein